MVNIIPWRNGVMAACLGVSLCLSVSLCVSVRLPVLCVYLCVSLFLCVCVCVRVFCFSLPLRRTKSGNTSGNTRQPVIFCSFTFLYFPVMGDIPHSS